MHPAFSMPTGRLLAFTRSTYEALLARSEDGEATHGENALLQVSWLATLHSLNSIRQEAVALGAKRTEELAVGLCGGLGQLALTRAFSLGKAIVTASLGYSTVIFSSLFGMLIWGEIMEASSWLAIGLIVASGVAATHFSRANPAEND